jgi:RNA polymerase sigma-70 factor (ECF subfamily)
LSLDVIDGLICTIFQMSLVGLARDWSKSMFESDSTVKPAAAQRDDELVSAAKAGSSAAFEELQNLYSRRLFRTIFAITKHREDAEDVLQDTLLRAFLSLQTFEGRSSIYSWLTRIAINSALMLVRKRRIRAVVCAEPLGELGGEMVPLEIKEPSPNPEELFDQSQQYLGALKDIQRLKPGLRSALLVRLQSDSSITDIARELDVSVAAIKSRLHRARLCLAAARAFRASQGKGASRLGRSAKALSNAFSARNGKAGDAIGAD